MEFIHKYAIVSLAEVFVGVSSELVVAVNHSTDSLHDPFRLVNWAHNVLVAVENGNWDFINRRDGDVRGDSACLTLSVLVRELLESALNTVLEVVLQSFGGNRLRLPDVMLFAPAPSEVGADVRLKVLPVVASETVQANHLNVAVEFIVVIVAHSASENVHLCARSQQDCTSDKVGVEFVFQVGESVEHLGCSLVVAEVKYLVGVLNVGLCYGLVNSVLDVANQSWQVVCTQLCEGPIPVIFSILVHAKLLVTLAMSCASVVAEPHVVSGLIELNWHWSTEFRAEEPRICGHADTWHNQHRLHGCPMHGSVTNEPLKPEEGEYVAVVCRGRVWFPIILKLIDCFAKALEMLVVVSRCSI